MLKSGFPHSCLASPGPLSKFKPNHQDKVGLGVGKEGSSAPHRRGLGRGHPLLPRPQLNGQIQMCHPEPSGRQQPEGGFVPGVPGGPTAFVRESRLSFFFQ